MKRKIEINEENVLISKLLQQHKIDFKLPCSGNQTCGKCKIKVTGNLSQMSAKEKSFLTNEEIKNNYRLACFTKAFSDVDIELNDFEYNEIVIDGLSINFNFDPVLDKNEYGIALDIGTTTLAMHLIKGDSPIPISGLTQVNAQKLYGADVISRINYAMNNSQNEVHNLIIDQINGMLKEIITQKNLGISTDDIKYFVVTGNTTMLHFFEGLDPKGIANAPFTTESLFGYFIENTINLNISDSAKIYIPPCISAYIGADLVCCILAGDMIYAKENSIVVDIGTNGEMALFKDGKLISCSTAAGPAFEGVSIKHGTPSISGAISKVDYNQKTNKIEYKTINDQAPIGICGSGIVDIVSILLDLKIMDQTGRLQTTGHPFENKVFDLEDGLSFKFDDCDIYITQKDIRQVQLAKAAVAAGIAILLDYSEVNIKAIDKLYISGGFGTYLNLQSAYNIGLLPQSENTETIILGNAALMGASLVMLDKTSIIKLNEINDICDYIELSTNTSFMEKYIDEMSFREV